MIGFVPFVFVVVGVVVVLFFAILLVTCGTHPLTVITVLALGSIRSICCLYV